METRILVISDTHGAIPDWLCDIKADAVIHAGDIGDRGTLNLLYCFDTVHAVRGNTDTLLDELPETVRSVIDGVRFFLVHNLTAPHRIMAGNAETLDAYRPRLVIFGHTHEPFIDEKKGVIYLNPGTLGRAGPNGKKTYAIVTLSDGAVRHIELFDSTTGRSIQTWRA
jgi:hypothetical protein